jgi:hypothetical protein
LERAFREEVEIGAVLGVQSDPLQLDAFRDEKGKLPSNVFQLARKPGPGRAPGAKNKRGPVLAKLICNQSGDPVLFMASIYSMPLDQLVELIKIASPGSGKAPPGDLAIRALSVQLQAAKEVSQYVHSKKPVEHIVDASVDFKAFFIGQHGLDSAPAQQALANAAEAVNKGLISEADLRDLRIVDGEFSELPMTSDEDDGE